MLTTLDTMVKMKLPATITIAGSHHQQIAHIQFNYYNRSILGRAYANLFQNPLTQTTNPTVSIPQIRPSNGLTSRKTEKIVWATTLLHDP